MTQGPAELNYAPRLPAYRRRRFRRAVVVVALGLLVAMGWWWHEAIVLHVRLLYWQRQCMAYAPPPGQVVYAPASGVTPQTARPWDRLYALLSPPGQRAAPTLFLHERRSPDGRRWLVAVHLIDTGLVHDGPRILPDIDLVAPGQGWAPPRLQRAPRRTLAVLANAACIYAGQPDPADPSHFTIDYDDATGQRRVLDGWVKDDLSVALEPRRAP